MSDEQAVSDEKVLFPDVKFKGTIIKPWSFGTLFDLANLLGTVIEKAEDKGLIEDLEDAATNSFITYKVIAKLFSISSNEILEIIQITSKLSKEEIRDLNIEDGIRLAMLIFEQNKKTITSSIKNVLSTPPHVPDSQK